MKLAWLGAVCALCACASGCIPISPEFTPETAPTSAAPPARLLRRPAPLPEAAKSYAGLYRPRYSPSEIGLAQKRGMDLAKLDIKLRILPEGRFRMMTADGLVEGVAAFEGGSIVLEPQRGGDEPLPPTTLLRGKLDERDQLVLRPDGYSNELVFARAKG